MRLPEQLEVLGVPREARPRLTEVDDVAVDARDVALKLDRSLTFSMPGNVYLRPQSVVEKANHPVHAEGAELLWEQASVDLGCIEHVVVEGLLDVLPKVPVRSFV